MSTPLWWLWLLGEATLKGTIVCLAILAVLPFVRRPTAGSKHLAMWLEIVSFVLVPIASLTLPAWEVLPAGSTRIAASSLDAPINGLDPLAVGDVSKPLPAVQRTTLASSPLRRTATPQTLLTRNVPVRSAALSGVNSGITSGGGGSWATMVVWLWAIGAIVALTPVLLGLARLAWMDRHARRFSVGPWVILQQKCRAALRISRPVMIRVSNRCAIPLVWGAWQPTILLPVTCKQWSARRREAVLMHELAHVKRWDCFTHLVTRTICAMFWFHPLVWWMLHRMTLERELACDDIVLASGTRRSDYAEHLLSIGNTRKTSPRQSHLLGSAALAMG